MLKLNYDAIHRFVEGNPNAFWDGWTMVLFKRTDAGASHPRGIVRNGKWGIGIRVDVDENGLWKFRA